VLTRVSASNLADAFCTSQYLVQILATSLLSAYSFLGNGSDVNYCGGGIARSDDGQHFDISIADY